MASYDRLPKKYKLDKDSARKLMASAKLEPVLDKVLEDFRAKMQVALDVYIETVVEYGKDKKRYIDALLKAAHTALKSRDDSGWKNLAQLIGVLPKHVWEHLECRTLPKGEITDLLKNLKAKPSERAARNLISLLTVEQKIKQGRKRPDGKRSRNIMITKTIVPSRGRGLPSYEAERVLLSFVGVAYAAAYEAEPAKTANSATPGPFVRLMKETLKLLGQGHINVVHLINTTKYSEE